MRINADFSQPARVLPRDEDWVHSPESGVDRLMLDRIGDEVARATSIVRYAPGSSFHEHGHEKGEEFLVLEGVFSDESGDYPAGHYVRNPPGSSHAPYSREGCTILVKLRQFADDDLERVVVDTADPLAWPAAGRSPQQLRLHGHRSEVVEMGRIAAGQSYMLEAPEGGAEFFVVEGAVTGDKGTLDKWRWLRLPTGDSIRLQATVDTVFWLKRGHLPTGS